MMLSSIVWGNSIFWLALLASIVLYAVKKRWYPIMYLVSIALYIFTAIYVIDVFDLSSDGILLVLAFSTVVMITTGLYLSRKYARR